MRIPLAFWFVIAAAACASPQPEYQYGRVEVEDQRARLPATTLGTAWDGKTTISIVSVVDEPDVAAVRVEREGEQFAWDGCTEAALIYGPQERVLIEASHRKDFSAAGHRLDVVSFALDGEALRELTLGQKPVIEVCGDRYPLNSMHQRSISEFIDAWNGIIQR